MKKFLSFALIMFSLLGFCGCKNANETPSQNEDTTVEEMEITKMKLSISDNDFDIKLENNQTVKSFCQLLPLEITMEELNGNEKYYYLDKTLPTNPQSVGSIQVGDIMLWGNNCLVIFYKSFSTSFQYTKIGSVENPQNLANLLGGGSIAVKWKVG